MPSKETKWNEIENICFVRCVLPKKPGKQWTWLNVYSVQLWNTHGTADYRFRHKMHYQIVTKCIKWMIGGLCTVGAVASCCFC